MWNVAEEVDPGYNTSNIFSSPFPLPLILCFLLIFVLHVITFAILFCCTSFFILFVFLFLFFFLFLFLFFASFDNALHDAGERALPGRVGGGRGGFFGDKGGLRLHAAEARGGWLACWILIKERRGGGEERKREGEGRGEERKETIEDTMHTSQGIH